MQSPTSNTFDTSIRAWLAAMDKAGRIKRGGRLVFVNRHTGSAVPLDRAPKNLTQVNG